MLVQRIGESQGRFHHQKHMTFEAEVVGGELRMSDETTDYGYFLVDNLDEMNLMEHHLERIQDAIKTLPDAIIK